MSLLLSILLLFPVCLCLPSFFPLLFLPFLFCFLLSFHSSVCPSFLPLFSFSVTKCYLWYDIPCFAFVSSLIPMFLSSSLPWILPHFLTPRVLFSQVSSLLSESLLNWWRTSVFYTKNSVILYVWKGVFADPCCGVCCSLWNLLFKPVCAEKERSTDSRASSPEPLVKCLNGVLSPEAPEWNQAPPPLAPDL